MPKCIIDGKEVEFSPGETIIQIADRNGIDIPRFCYHPALTVVAQCRMCAVEVEKSPKLQTACSLPATDGMVVSTTSDKVKKMRASVMEFTLINHPLDCPICDEAGECTLQDYSFAHGAPDQRYEEERRVFIDADMGPVIKKNMNRCIHCTRCIRFCDEIGGTREMVALKRGNSTEIVTVDGSPLKTEYAGNLSDICPTGSLTLKDFRFKKRAWFLKKTKTVCEGCSQGCNIEVHHEDGKIYRVIPRENQQINKWWICDEGRFLFHYVHSKSRIIEPQVRKGGAKHFENSSWESAVRTVTEMLRGESLSGSKGKTLILLGTDLTLEEMRSVQKFAETTFPDFECRHFGTEEHQSAANDRDEDKILRRSSKTGNLHGAEKLKLRGWDGVGQHNTVLVFSGGRSKVPRSIRNTKTKWIIGLGVFNEQVVDEFDLVLPGLSAFEKSGTMVNWQGREQYFERAIEAVGSSKPLDEIFQMWGAQWTR